jgi:hypothetical protein
MGLHHVHPVQETGIEISEETRDSTHGPLPALLETTVKILRPGRPGHRGKNLDGPADFDYA